MAKIVLSDLAPSDAKSFSLGNYVIEAPTESTDPGLLAEATVHPWLAVEYDESETLVGEFVELSVAREDDVLAAENSVAFDPEAIKAAEADKAEARGDGTAIDAGLDQGKVVEVEGVNLTLAADANDPDEKPAPRKRAAADKE